MRKACSKATKVLGVAIVMSLALPGVAQAVTPTASQAGTAKGEQSATTTGGYESLAELLMERIWQTEAPEDASLAWQYEPPKKGHAQGVDIARAAVDLATSASPDPQYTNEMDEHGAHYREVHDRLLPGEDIKPCSTVVSVAVHLADADPDFPPNTSAIIHSYCAKSPKWRLVGHSPAKEEMQPGDIFTSTYHTYMYIGNDVVRERFPDSDADVYTGGNQLPFLYLDSYEDKNFDVYRFVGNDWLLDYESSLLS